ncbi:MAG: prepilin-type N-terminal cleavage/methylation domain-containing protein [Phycisphaeraceae bacterium]|nr:prepilin-type N-terminal cleavage/methylation domain-containing protein [Phycisphaeraceae bacterium]
MTAKGNLGDRRVGARTGRGFTLNELLVVIAIVALLLGLLLPGLGAALAAAREVVCASTLRGLAQGQQFYMADWRDFYAGPNTSGALYQAIGEQGEVMADRLLFETTSSTPTTVFDWISPTIGESYHLAANRARRTGQIFNQLGCAGARRYNNTVFEWHRTEDGEQFKDLVERQGVRQISYLSPDAFHLKPNETIADRQRYVAPGIRPVKLKWDRFLAPFRTPDTFNPRLDLVGTQVANKIMIADGTRYYEEGELDFDPSPNPVFFSSFLSASPIFDRDTSYGRRHHGSPENLLLSYRHPRKRINAAYFDGHVGGMSQVESWSDPTPWAPTRTIFRHQSATPEAQAAYEDGYRIP